MKKFSKVFAVFMTSAMLLTACGAASDTTTSAAGDTGNTPEGTTTASSSLPDKIIVGTNAEFPPFEFMNDSNEIDGFDVAVIKEVGKRIGCEVEMNNMEFDNLIAAMQAGNLDVIAAGMTVTKERQEKVDFSKGYYTADQYIVVNKDSTVKKLNDLDGKKIGVQGGTTGDLVASDEYDDTHEVGVKDADVKRYNKGVDAIMALRNGALDAVIIDSNPAQEFTKANEDKLKCVEDHSTQEEYAFAVKKGNEALLNAMNQALDEMKADGTFDNLVKEYITQ